MGLQEQDSPPPPPACPLVPPSLLASLPSFLPAPCPGSNPHSPAHPSPPQSQGVLEAQAVLGVQWGLLARALPSHPEIPRRSKRGQQDVCVNHIRLARKGTGIPVPWVQPEGRLQGAL